MTLRRDESGFTLIELMVSIFLFATISSGIYAVMFSGVRGGETTRSVARVSEEARLGFNRMIRETREAGVVATCGPGVEMATCYRVQVDFNRDGEITLEKANLSGDFEDLRFRFDEANGRILLNEEILIDGVSRASGQDVFSYESNLLEYDSDGNGVTTWQELDASGVAGVGNGNVKLDDTELEHVSSVQYAFRVRNSARAATFYAQAQLRNKRSGGEA